MNIKREQNEITITLSEEELKNSFKSYHEFQLTLHEMVERAYDKDTADLLFPIGENINEHI